MTQGAQQVIAIKVDPLKGDVGRVLESGHGLLHVQLAADDVWLMKSDVVRLPQEAPYPDTYHLRRGQDRRVAIHDENGFFVAEALPSDARLLAAAPALLDMVEKLARIARGSGYVAPVVVEAEAAVAFLRRETVPCPGCEGGVCLACGGLGVVVGQKEEA